MKKFETFKRLEVSGCYKSSTQSNTELTSTESAFDNQLVSFQNENSTEFAVTDFFYTNDENLQFWKNRKHEKLRKRKEKPILGSENPKIRKMDFMMFIGSIKPHCYCKNTSSEKNTRTSNKCKDIETVFQIVNGTDAANTDRNLIKKNLKYYFII